MVPVIYYIPNVAPPRVEHNTVKYIENIDEIDSDMEREGEWSNDPRFDFTVLVLAYNFNVEIAWHSGCGFREISSQENDITTTFLDEHHVSIQCCNPTESGDFSVCVKTNETSAAYSYRDAETDSTFLCVHHQIPSGRLNLLALRKITYLLDCTYTMDRGDKLKAAVAVIKHHISQLTDNYHLHVVCMGEEYRVLFAHPVRIAPSTIDKCLEFLKTCVIEGGTVRPHVCAACLPQCMTEVMGDAITAEYAFPSRPPEPSMPHDIVLVLACDLTVATKQKIHTALQCPPKHCRILTLGVGAMVDKYLVHHIAERTNGLSKCVGDSPEEITTALTDMFHFMGQQYHTHVCMPALTGETSQLSTVLCPAHPVDMFVKIPADNEHSRSISVVVNISSHDPVYSCERCLCIPVVDCGQSLIEKLYAHTEVTQFQSELGCATFDETIDTENATLRIQQLSQQYNLMTEQHSTMRMTAINDSVNSVSNCTTAMIDTTSYAFQYIAEEFHRDRHKTSSVFGMTLQYFALLRLMREFTTPKPLPLTEANVPANPTLQKLLLVFRNKDGYFQYSKDSYLLIQYSSRDLFDTHVMGADVSCAEYFNICVLIYLSHSAPTLSVTASLKLCVESRLDAKFGDSAQSVFATAKGLYEKVLFPGD